MEISDELRKLVDPNNECCCEHCLSNKCKEWAWKAGYGMTIYYEDDFSFNVQVAKFTAKQQPKEWSSGNTEPEAIFQATQWILNQRNKS